MTKLTRKTISARLIERINGESTSKVRRGNRIAHGALPRYYAALVAAGAEIKPTSLRVMITNYLNNRPGAALPDCVIADLGLAIVPRKKASVEYQEKE